MHHDLSRRVSSKNQGFHGDQAWVHWEYSPEEWATFDRVDWRTVWLRYWLLNLAPLVGLFILGILGVVFFPANSLGIVAGVIGFGITLLLPLLIVLFAVRRYSYLEAKKRHQARQNQAQPLRVTFSKEGVWEAGTFFPLRDALREVRMTSQPTVLHFRRKRHFTSLSGRYTEADTLRVFVPGGHEAGATQLMERFRNEVIEAATKKPTYSPPEPV